MSETPTPVADDSNFDLDGAVAPQIVPAEMPAEPATRGRSWIHVLAWFAFFIGIFVLNTFPWWIHLLGGPKFVIEPGILDDPGAIGVSIVSSWALFLVAALLARAAGMTRQELGWRKVPWRIFFGWTALVTAGLIAVWSLVSAIGGESLHVIEPITRAPQGPLHWLLWLGLAFTAGFSEEFMMRGYGIGFWLRRGAPRWPIAFATSALFGSLHLYEGRHAAIVIAVWGALFAWSYIRTGSLWPAIAAHTLIDAAAPLEFLF